LHLKHLRLKGEGFNSMIQSIRHSARGLPNFASLRTRVLFHLGRLQLKPS
jgi:hypothetical protein